MSKILTIRLEEDLIDRIDAVSKKLDRSKNWVIKQVLKNYLEEMYDVEEAKRIILDKTDKTIDHEEAKKETLSD